jgi:thiamine biosynthesis lipoprotein
MIRCKPLLGTYVEISTSDGIHSAQAIEGAFIAIEKVQALMSFHDAQSELSKINALAHLQSVSIDPWTARALRIAQKLHQQSNGLFNCGIGQHLVKSDLLPKHCSNNRSEFGGIEHLLFLEDHLIRSSKPLCLDLGGIAKGFAVDMAVNVLQDAGIHSASVNAGGDLRLFGDTAKTIYLRNPGNPQALLDVGTLQNGAMATSGLYFAKGARSAYKQSCSHIVDPIRQASIHFSESYSVIAHECVFADALTKVVSISGNTNHPCLTYFSAQSIKAPAQ